MPLLSILAPRTRVTVEGMVLPGARVLAATVRAGADPVRYEIEWTEGKVVRRGEWKAIAVTEAADDAPEALDPAQVLAQLAAMKEKIAALEAQRSQQ